MAKDNYFLDQTDRDTLARIVKWWRNTQGVPKPRYRNTDDTSDDRGVYLARSVSGINARAANTTGTGTGTVTDDDVPGSADCEIYKVIDNDGTLSIAHAGFIRTLLNFSGHPIPPNRWVLALQDDFGTWYALSFDGSDGGSSGLLDCSVLGSRISNVCLTGGHLVVEWQSYNRCTDEVISTWCVINPSDCCPLFVPCCEDGKVGRTLCATVRATGESHELTYVDDPSSIGWDNIGPGDHPVTNIWVSEQVWTVDCGIFGVNQVRMLFYCYVLNSTPPLSHVWGVAWFHDNGDWSGHSCDGLTISESDFSCDPLAIVLEDVSLGSTYGIIDLTEGECVGTGSGTNGDTTGDKVSTKSCPSGFKKTLNVTISGPGCCLNGTYPIVWDNVQYWKYSGFLCSGKPFSLQFFDNGSQMELDYLCGLNGYNIPFAGCDLPLTNSLTLGPSFECCPSVSVSFTITE